MLNRPCRTRQAFVQEIHRSEDNHEIFQKRRMAIIEKVINDEVKLDDTVLPDTHASQDQYLTWVAARLWSDNE